MSDNLDPYAVLDVSPSATPAEITHAYRQKLRAQHPDTRTAPTGAIGLADEKLRRVLAAYAILRDPAGRAAYDRRARTTTQPRVVSTTTPGTPHQRVDIPVTLTFRPRIDFPRTPPLWAGPVRRHRGT